MNGLKAGIKYNFVVEGYNGGSRVAISDTAYVLTGKGMVASNSEPGVQWHHWIPINGRIPMYFIGRGYVFDAATKAGKIAFHLIWNFFLMGLIIVLFCIRYLRLSQIFPFQKGVRIGKGFDDVYKQGMTADFRDIINEWRDLVEDGNEHIRNVLEQGKHSRVEEIEVENVEFWRKKGAETIRRLTARLQRLRQYPTARIVQAGLENHELGGFRWLEVSKEVDRAIENRASSELEHLRRKSHMDWLWNLGTLSPLVGLFGTATGISYVFATLSMLRTNITQNILVNRLAGGIYEALWTTIEGLFVGISLMILYYYYHNKLNWVYSKWEEIYVHISEKL
jgi:biopolymer transport protein ExbB/TolQ